MEESSIRKLEPHFQVLYVLTMRKVVRHQGCCRGRGETSTHCPRKHVPFYPGDSPDMSQFEDAGIHPVVLNNIHLCMYEHPTPIQAYAIPAVLKGHDIIATAQTGKRKPSLTSQFV